MTVRPAVDAKVLVVYASSKKRDVGAVKTILLYPLGNRVKQNWRTFSWAALGAVVVVEQIMEAANYLNIIADQLHPYRTERRPLPPYP
ncbi:hypothetical protein AVEN_46159-1 [Araneus ventricosus]|uniref:Uncharacterized protein n=1 Tax=Araneus ventricosus TaxID=182803 RepID=A0A4Y2DAU5_ARAVE|nr:hypothetical protein AVEN_46159-1 [Araneus ventricosus]